MLLDRFNRRTLLRSTVLWGGITRIASAQGKISPKGTTPSALALAQIVNEAMTYASLPPLPVKHAKMILASTFSSAAAGAKIGSARMIRELSKELGGKPEATIWFNEAKLPVTSAARVNAMQSDAA